MLQHQLVNLITHYGYLAVFVLMLAESACIPVPSEVVMMFGGALAAGAVGSGSPPSLIGVVVAGVLGNIAGSYLAWAVGKYAGRAAITRWGRRIGVREHEIDRAVAWFERHGPVAVLLGRVVPVIRTFISLPAGFADMPAARFGLYTAVGCIPWTAALGIAGYAVGANYDHVAKDFSWPTYAIVGVLVVAVIVFLVRRRRAAKPFQPARRPGALPGREPSSYARVPGDFGALPGQEPSSYAPVPGDFGALPGQEPSSYARGSRDAGTVPGGEPSPYARVPREAGAVLGGEPTSYARVPPDAGAPRDDRDPRAQPAASTQGSRTHAPVGSHGPWEQPPAGQQPSRTQPSGGQQDPWAQPPPGQPPPGQPPPGQPPPGQPPAKTQPSGGQQAPMTQPPAGQGPWAHPTAGRQDPWAQPSARPSR